LGLRKAQQPGTDAWRHWKAIVRLLLIHLATAHRWTGLGMVWSTAAPRAQRCKERGRPSDVVASDGAPVVQVAGVPFWWSHPGRALCGDTWLPERDLMTYVNCTARAAIGRKIAMRPVRFWLWTPVLGVWRGLEAARELGSPPGLPGIWRQSASCPGTLSAQA